MLHAIQRTRMQVAADLFIERQSQRLGIELATRGLVANDRTKTGDEQHVDVFRRFHRQISFLLC